MKTSEMIAMLEKNPKLSFKGEEYVFNSIKSPEGVSFTLDFLLKDIDWQLIREPVPVWEAIKALTEGEIIKCEMNAFDWFYLSPEKIERGGTEFDMSWIKKGKWYIKEDNQ